MKRAFFLSLVFVMGLSAQTLESLIASALKKHNSLKLIEHKLSAMDDSLKLSQKFANPEVALSISDIQFDDPTNRSIEPMQYQAITFKQKIPYFGKRDAAESLVEKQKAVLFASLASAKVALAKEIRVSVYTVWEQKSKLKIVDEFMELNVKNAQLSNVYSSSGSSAHMKSMLIGLSNLELSITKSRLQATLDALYKRVSYLSAQEVKSLELEFTLVKPKSLKEYVALLENNKEYQKSSAEIKASESFVKVKELESNIDPFVKVGYYNRSAFNDYINISIGASLPLYGTETLKESRARKEILVAASARSDLYEKLRSNLGALHSKMLSEYAVYKIIQDESLVELEHMFELSTTGVKNGENLLLYTQMLEKKLKLEEQKVSAMAAFKRSEAEMTALLGGTKI